MKNYFFWHFFVLCTICIFSCDWDNDFFEGYYVGDTGKYADTIEKEITLEAGGEARYYGDFSDQFYWSFDCSNSYQTLTVSDDYTFGSVLFSKTYNGFDSTEPKVFSEDETGRLYFKLKNNKQERVTFTLYIGYCSKNSDGDNIDANVINHFELYELPND